MPFPGSVAALADAFGIVFLNGHALKSASGGGLLVFTREAGSLADHPMTCDRTADEQVPSVKEHCCRFIWYCIPDCTWQVHDGRSGPPMPLTSLPLRPIELAHRAGPSV